jgi:transcriptional regulator with XRE-family HTH domain
MNDLGERIRSRRIELGWTATRLAKAAGLSKSFLSDVENGKRRVGADSLLALGNALGLPLDQLMKGTHEPYRPDAAIQVTFPAGLLRWAAEMNVPFRHVLAVYWMMRTALDHRQNDRKGSMDEVDWLKFYEAVREWL